MNLLSYSAIIALSALMPAIQVEAAIGMSGEVSCLANNTDICVGWTVQTTPPPLCPEGEESPFCLEKYPEGSYIYYEYTFVEGLEAGTELNESEAGTYATGLKVKVVSPLRPEEGGCGIYVGNNTEELNQGNEKCNMCSQCAGALMFDCTNVPNGRKNDQCEDSFPIFYPLKFANPDTATPTASLTTIPSGDPIKSTSSNPAPESSATTALENRDQTSPSAAPTRHPAVEATPLVFEGAGQPFGSSAAHNLSLTSTQVLLSILACGSWLLA